MKMKSISEDNSSPPKPRIQLEDPVENSFKWILILGRLIGISPISLSPKSALGSLTFRWKSLATLHAISFPCIVIGTYMPGLWKSLRQFGNQRDILGEMIVLSGNLYNWALLAIYIYWLRSSPKIVHIFKRWSATMRTLKLGTTDKKFPMFCLNVTTLLLGGCLMETALYLSWDIRNNASRWKGDTFMEKLYRSHVSGLAKFLPHLSDPTSFLLVYGYRVGIFCWNFADIFVIILCRALAHKYKEIDDEIHSTVYKMQFYDKTNQIPSKRGTVRISIIEPKQGNETIWKEIREKTLALGWLTKEVADLVAPILLISFTHIILVLITHVIRYVYVANLAYNAYVYVSIYQYAMRLILLIYFPSQLYHSTERLLKSVERSPDNNFSISGYRLEMLLERHPVGVNLLGTVVITRAAFLSILSFIFSTEIVVLQAMSAAAGRK